MLLSRVVIDSSARNPDRFPSSNDFETDVSHLYLDDIVEIRLVYASVPLPEPHVSRGRDLLYLDGGASPTVKLTRGKYDSAAHLCRELTLSLRRDAGPGFTAYVTRQGRVAIASFTPFTVNTTSPFKSKDSKGFAQAVPLTGSAASVLGFAIGAPQPALPVENRFFAIAEHAPLNKVDEVAIVRISHVCGVKSNSLPFDRAFAVLHGGREIDPLPTVHANEPPRVNLSTLRVQIQRRDGTPFDMDGRDMTLHLDVVKQKPYR